MTDASYPRQGGCTCGAIRYQLESKPLFVHCCHCHWCQRETGASFALNAMIEADRVTLLQGQPVVVVTPSDSGKGQKIWRCRDCHIAASKQDWVVIPKGDLAVERYYDREECWPEDSLLRRKRLLEQQAPAS